MALNGRTGRLAAQAWALAPRLFVLSLVGLATVMLVVGRTHQDAVQDIRGGFTDAVAPVLLALGKPVDLVQGGLETVAELFEVRGENARLRDEVARLQQWQAVARRLEQENAAYRAMLHVRSDAEPTFVTARVIADAGGPFVRTLLVNAGARDGVEKGQPVISGDGMVGRVVEVAGRSARVLLLTDLNSRVPVVLERSRYRGVLAGDNTDRPRLIFLPANARPEPGDRVVTSGHGGVFPPGVPVGTVERIGDGEPRVVTLVDFDRLEYVRVVRHDLSRHGLRAEP